MSALAKASTISNPGAKSNKPFFVLFTSAMIIRRKEESTVEDDKKKNPPVFKTSYKKKYRTGEDIDMLNERYTDPESGGWGSSSYKDHIDGA